MVHPKANSKSVPLPRQLNVSLYYGWYANIFYENLKCKNFLLSV